MNHRLLLPPVLAFLLLFGGCTKHRREARLLRSAEKAVAAGKYDEAEADYHNALKLVPNELNATRGLGSLFFDEGLYAKAYLPIKQAVAAVPTDYETLLKLGRIQQAEGAPLEARATAKTLLQIHAPTDESLMLLLTTSGSKAELAETRTLIDQVRAHDQDRACYHLANGAFLVFDQKLAEAEVEFRKALVLDPKSTVARVERADSLLAQHQAKEAAVELKTAADLSPVRSGYRLRYIGFELANGITADAWKRLDEINAQAPDYLPAWIVRMKVSFADKRYDDCDLAVHKILERDEHNFDAQLQTGIVQLARRQPDAALSTFEHLENLYPRSAAVEYQLARTHLAKGQTSLAETSLQQAVTLSPTNEEAVVELADLQVHNHDPMTAIASLTQLLKRDPRSGPAYLVLARAYQAQKNPDQVLVVLNRALQVYPDNPQVPYLMGMVLNSQGKRAEARQKFEQTWDLNPGFTPALEMLVDSNLEDKLTDAARKIVAAAREKIPANPTPLLLSAKVRLVEKDTAGARLDLLAAVKLDPNAPLPYILLARLDFSLNNQKAGIAELQASADKTGDQTSLMELALIQAQLKDYAAAKTAYQRLIAANPKFVPALNNLAVLYTENFGQPEQGEPFAVRARNLRPEDPQVADTLGWTRFRRRAYSEALPLLAEAAERNPTDASTQYHLGVTRYMLNQPDEARTGLQAMAASSALSAEKSDAQRRLALISIDPETATASAIPALQQGLRDDPNDPVARFRLGSIEARQGEAKTAAQDFTTLLKNHPRDAQTLLALARLEAGPLGDLARARDLARTAHEVAPDDLAITAALGHIFFENGESVRSAELLQQAVHRYPDTPSLAWDLAQAQYATGQVARTEATLQTLLAEPTTFPQRDEAERMAIMLSALHQPELPATALATAQLLLSTDPKLVPALMVQGAAQEQASKFADAASTYGKAIDAAPLFFPATRKLAILYHTHLHDDKRAYDLAVQARKDIPDDLELNRLMGQIDFRRKEYPSASRAFQTILLQSRDDADASFHLGMCQHEMRVGDRGKAQLQKALDLGLDDQEAEIARAALRES